MPMRSQTIRTLKNWGTEVRLLETGPIDRSKIDANEMDVRCIVGGLLLQKRDLVGWEPDTLTYPTKANGRPQEQLEDLRARLDYRKARQEPIR